MNSLLKQGCHYSKKKSQPELVKFKKKIKKYLIRINKINYLKTTNFLIQILFFTFLVVTVERNRN